MDVFRSAQCAKQVLHPQRLRLRNITTAASPAQSPAPLNPNTSSTLLTLQPQTLHYYTESIPPTTPQLAYSNTFFASSPPRHLWTAAHFRSFPPSPRPEVAFLGRSNVGKSSLLNALFNRPKVKAAHVSSKPGRTRTMNAFGVGGEQVDIGARTEKWKSLGRGGVVVVDMPGYGKGSREEWGKEILKYVEGRKQLRRTFLLVDAEHGLKSTDISLLEHFRDRGIAHQIILSKVDKLLYPHAKAPSPQGLSNRLLKLRDVCENIRKQVQPDDYRGPKALGDILCCSSEREGQNLGAGRGKLGIDAVRWAVLSATALDCDEAGRPRGIGDYTVLEEEQ